MHRNNLFSKNSASGTGLTENEKETLDAIEQVIDSKDDKDIEDLINALIKYPVYLLQKLYNTSTKFENFCQSNIRFHGAIANKLQKFGNINVEIHSIDNKEHFSIFNLFIAVLIFSQYDKNLPNIRTSNEARVCCIQSLETACELGLYNALTARCKQNINKISNTSISSEEKKEAVESILMDTKRLSNLYWAMGYIQAGCLLQKTANQLLQIEEEKDRAVIIYEDGIKNLLCASLLEKHSYSEKIEKSLTEEKGYLSQMEMKTDGKEVRTWEDARIILNDWSGSHATYERLLNAAKIEIDPILKKSEIGSKLRL